MGFIKNTDDIKMNFVLRVFSFLIFRLSEIRFKINFVSKNFFIRHSLFKRIAHSEKISFEKIGTSLWT